MKVAVLFPGQGAQAVGMGQAVCARYPEARDAFAVASAACGLDLAALCANGPAERLAETEVTQPALLATSAAILAVLVARGLRPAVAAGLSLGEYSALLAAGCAGVGPLAALVRRRGRYMQEAVPAGEGAMAAVLGLEPDGVERLCATALATLPEEAPVGGWVLSPANFNCPGQIVIAGHAPAVAAAVAGGRAAGARRVVPLPVSAPFHCALMQPAADRLAPDLAALDLSGAALPIVGNAFARAETDPERIRAALLAQVCRPVLWQDCVQAMAAMGADTFVEIGPGRALTGFVQRILPGARVLAVDEPDAIEACAQELGLA